MVGWHHRLDGLSESEQAGGMVKDGVLQPTGSLRGERD